MPEFDFPFFLLEIFPNDQKDVDRISNAVDIMCMQRRLGLMMFSLLIISQYLPVEKQALDLPQLYCRVSCDLWST